MPDLRDRLLYPRAGWLSLLLLGVMVLALSWSVQGAGWLPRLEFLTPVAIWAVLAGALLAVLPISVVVTLPAGALLGGLLVIWSVGGEYFPTLDEAGRIFALRDELATWILVLVRTGYPSELSPYALALGVIMWVTAFMAAYTVYRHNRVVDAIVLLGAALITNMSATIADLFVHLLLFVAAALLLWLRAALAERQESWQRRRVTENVEVPAAIMRMGIRFGAVAVVLAWLLTSVAVAAPLTNAWSSFDGMWSEVRDRFDGVFGSLTNPQSRITGTSFGSAFTVLGSWVSNDDEVLELTSARPFYLRTVTYDTYTGRGWLRSDGTQRQVPAGEPLFTEATPERPIVPEAVRIENVTIEMLQGIGRNLFTVGSPLEVYAPVVVHESGGYPVLGGIWSPVALAAGESYQLAAAVSQATEVQLASAGTDYPEEVRALYLDASLATDGVRQLAQQVTAGFTTPYEQAKALAEFLRTHDSFTYSTTAPVPSPGVDLVDFFLNDPEFGRVGYCQHYASAMVLMARSLGIPARVAAGFAPGERQDGGIFLVREAHAHAWAEIYFPGYGWEIFEATKTIDPQFRRATGNPAQAGPINRTGVDPLLDFDRFQNEDWAGEPFDPIPGAIDPDTGTAIAEQDSRPGNALVLAALVLGAGALVWARMHFAERRWRLLPVGDRVWEQLTLAAQRAGVGPRPSETIYEYAGWLEDQLPVHAEPIRTVADGKVWQAYSGRRMTISAAQRLEAAIRRLRRPLAWLAIRRALRSLFRRAH